MPLPTREGRDGTGHRLHREGLVTLKAGVHQSTVTCHHWKSCSHRHLLSAAEATASSLAKCPLAIKTHRTTAVAPGALSPAPPSPGGSSHGGRQRPRGRPCSTWRQAGWVPAAGGLPSWGGWQVVPVTHGGKTPPPLQAEAKHSSGYQVVSSLLSANPPPHNVAAHSTGGVSSPGGHWPRYCPQPIPSWGFAPYSPSAPATGQRAPTAATLPSQHPCRGLLPLRKGHTVFPPSHRGGVTGREALPSEDGHFLAQIPRYRALGYHLRGQQLKLSVLLGTTVEKCWPHSEFLSEKGVIVPQTALTPKILAVAQQLFRVWLPAQNSDLRLQRVKCSIYFSKICSAKWLSWDNSYNEFSSW